MTKGTETLKLSYAQWVALDYMLKPGARCSHSYGSTHMVWRPKDGKMDQVFRVHDATFNWLLRNGLIEKDVVQSAERTWYTSYYRITAKGRAAHDAREKPAGAPHPVERLTKFQAELLRDALANKEVPGIIGRWGLRESTRDFLEEHGYIERRLRYNTEEKRKARDQAILKAQIALAKHDAQPGSGHWHSAWRYLEDARRLDDDMVERAYFVTEKGRKAVEQRGGKA